MGYSISYEVDTGGREEAWKLSVGGQYQSRRPLEERRAKFPGHGRVG